MSSKIPRLVSKEEFSLEWEFNLGTAKTDDEKLHITKGARPKQIELKSSETLKTDGTSEIKKVKNFEKEPKLMKNKTPIYSGLKIKPKTTNEKTKLLKFNIQNKKSITEGCVSDPENFKMLNEKTISCGSDKENNKQLLLDREKPENIRKTENPNKSPGFAGISFIPKELRSRKPKLELNKTFRRTKTESDIKIGKVLEEKNDKYFQIVHTNKSKTLNQKDLKHSDIFSPEISEAMGNELAQELIPSNEKCHAGLKFLPKLKKKRSLFSFNIDKISK